MTVIIIIIIIIIIISRLLNSELSSSCLNPLMGSGNYNATKKLFCQQRAEYTMLPHI
jgi:hypothetical protein